MCPVAEATYIVDPFLSIVHRMIPGSERNVSLSLARTGGEVSKVTVKWLKKNGISHLCITCIPVSDVSSIPHSTSFREITLLRETAQ